MCTAITLRTGEGDFFFARTMDFSYPLDPELYLMPRGYSWNNALGTQRFQNRYSFLGIGQDISPVTFADGVNEAGFAAAALYFPGCARYDPDPGPDYPGGAVAAVEMVNFLLGRCSSVEEAKEVLGSVRIVGTKDAVTGTVAPLHWFLADQGGGCAAAEKTEEGLRIWENPLGLLSNSPDFGWQMTNLRGYLGLSPRQSEGEEWGPAELVPFGQGAGGRGLPGDYTPPSRFVRTAFQKTHLSPPPDRAGAVAACMHLLAGVSIPRGVVITGRGTDDYTQYKAVVDLGGREYFFCTYENLQIASAKLPPHFQGKNAVSLGKLRRPVTWERF